MGTEIERKFLIQGEGWRAGQSYLLRQGYLNRNRQRNVRVRTIEHHSGQVDAYLTVKGLTQGTTRTEFEYAIPPEDARQMLDELCERPLIEKRRFRVEFDGKFWEVDEFFGENAGLVMAEVELQSENEAVNLPDWIGQEVTHDSRYFNSNLSLHPFRQWNSEDLTP